MAQTVPILSARNLTAKRSWRVVFTDVSLDVNCGDRIYVTGQNGSGKTTLLETLLGLHPSAGGSLNWQGKAGSPQSHKAFVKRELFYLPQHNNLFKSLTLRQNILIGGVSVASSRRENLLRALELVPELKTGLDRKPGETSAGQRQIAAFLRLIVRRPELIVLDEPTAGIAGSLLPVMYQLIQKYSSPDSAIIFTDQHTDIARTIATDEFVLEGRRLHGGSPRREVKT